VKKIYMGQLSLGYFNDMAYGRRETPGEFMYNAPRPERLKELWEPKQPCREAARHVVRDVQDARWVK